MSEALHRPAGCAGSCPSIGSKRIFGAAKRGERSALVSLPRLNDFIETRCLSTSSARASCRARDLVHACDLELSVAAFEQIGFLRVRAERRGPNVDSRLQPGC